jgi:hypothetical protein
MWQSDPSLAFLLYSELGLMDLEWTVPEVSGVPLVAWSACQKYTQLHIMKISVRKGIFL